VEKPIMAERAAVLNLLNIVVLLVFAEAMRGD
jgi:hypothetical protein